VTASALATRWLSPTSAWRLMACPASLDTPHDTPPSLSPNAGTIAHQAIQRWIETGDWADPTRRNEQLAAQFDAAAHNARAEIAVLRDGRMTRARLTARADQLAAQLIELTSGGASITCEEPLTDPQRRLRGIPDIAVHGARTAVIDFKTGRDATVPLTERIRLQLLIYAHLYRCTHGQLPEIVEAFSLIHGPLRVPVDNATVETTLNTITMARTQDPELARPSPTVCTFCTRRFVCEPHWNAVQTWDEPDALEGRIASIEHAKTGAVALLIETPLGSQWITRIPRDRLPARTGAGSYVRIIHAYRSNANYSHAAIQEWHAGRLVGIRSCQPRGG
jgi:PD-(D/E)XK nuclease superfamily